MSVGGDTMKEWRYVEIDGDRYEFCNINDCPCVENLRCLHIKSKIKGDDGICIYIKVTKAQNVKECPARIIEDVKVCPACLGDGIEKYLNKTNKPISCIPCKGTGKLPKEREYIKNVRCLICGGSYPSVCDHCKGTGWEP
jgi:hypothetical protein